MKTCRKCSVAKPLADFYSKPDGSPYSPCKECIKANVARYRRADPDAHRERRRRERQRAIPGTIAARQKRARDADPERYRAINVRWIAAHSDRVAISNRAGKIVGAAIRRGELTRPGTCEECGRGDCQIEAAHADYSKPLEVRWLCKRCHARWDAASPKTVRDGFSCMGDVS